MASTDTKEIGKKLLASKSEEILGQLLCLVSSSLLDDGSNLCSRVGNLGIDLKRNRGQLELLKEKLTLLREFITERDLSANANPRRRRVYIEEFTKLLDECAVQIENLVQAIYNDAKEGSSQDKGLWGTIRFGLYAITAITFIGSAISSMITGNTSSIALVLGAGSLTAIGGYNRYKAHQAGSSFASDIEELRNDTEKFRKEMNQIRTKIIFKLIELMADEASRSGE